MPWPTCGSWTGCAPPPPGNFPSRGPVLRGKGSQGVIGDADEDALGLLHGPSGGSQQRGGTGPQGPGAYAKGARDEGLARGSAAGRAPARIVQHVSPWSSGAGPGRPPTFRGGTTFGRGAARVPGPTRAARAAAAGALPRSVRPSAAAWPQPGLVCTLRLPLPHRLPLRPDPPGPRAARPVWALGRPPRLQGSEAARAGDG